MRHHPIRRVLRTVGAALLIAAVARVPLPMLDFHSIRHHDGPNGVCEHHDHLLRWHPDAVAVADVAVLHWHWLMPMGLGDESGADGSRPRIHAHVPDLAMGGLGVAEPGLGPESHAGWSAATLRAPGSGLVIWWAADLAGGVRHFASGTGARALVRGWGPAAPTAAVLAAHLQRWTC
jgi:hypothetical protein